MAKTGEQAPVTSNLGIFNELPGELCQDVIERLELADLKRLNATCRGWYALATPLIWREVELVDCRTKHGPDAWDEHDDTPLIRKLILLVQKPWLASCVHILGHRCHVPPPEIFTELPQTPFSSQTLSTDPRTTRLIRLASKHMTNVHTLRIIFGHPNLSEALIRCFFDKERKDQDCVPVRRLWLENCRISAGCCLSIDYHPHGLPLQLDFTGLESVRFRRLPLRADTATDNQRYGWQWVYSRRIRPADVAEGGNPRFPTTVNGTITELTAGEAQLLWQTGSVKLGRLPGQPLPSPLMKFYEDAHHLDQMIYDKIASEVSVPGEVEELGSLTAEQRSTLAYRGIWLDPPSSERSDMDESLRKMQREQLPSLDVAAAFLRNASSSLTSLTLDWVLCGRRAWEDERSRPFPPPTSLFFFLFNCRFPHLRAFQFRNCVVLETQMPEDIFLCETSVPDLSDPKESQFWQETDMKSTFPWRLGALAFLEAHPKLQCLAWPMDQFFSMAEMPESVSSRLDAVLQTLGRNLVELRVDTLFTNRLVGEFRSEDETSPYADSRARRRKFIATFAPKMHNVEVVKIEGGMPQDERRELIRALHACPLKKIVMIGIRCPLGNMWGGNGADIARTDDLFEQEVQGLEAEDKDVFFALGSKKPEPPQSPFKFQAEYGWDNAPPMLYTLACFHADTITEMKFCGYKGAPTLFAPTPITAPCLAALKYFHKLESLIMSLWLYTSFEGSSRSEDIISYWRNTRDPTSTALVRTSDEEVGPWEKELKTKFAPDALTQHVVGFVGQYLSEQAKKRKGGVHVRSSFCIGHDGSMFDIDMHIGKDAAGRDVCLGYRGPREELEPERRRSKLVNRRWF